MAKPRACVCVLLLLGLGVGRVLVHAAALTEHYGQVTLGGLAVPGATVTATRGDQTVTTTSGPDGAFRFADLADGPWTIRVAMRGFAPVTREVVVAPGATGERWALTIEPFAAIARDLPPPGTRAPLRPAEAPDARVDRTVGAEAGTGQGAAPAGRPAAAPRATVRPAGTAAAAPAVPAEASADPNAADGLVINGSVNNGAASPFAQSGAFGNNRRGGRSLYNFQVGVAGRSSAFDARPYSFTGQSVALPDYTNLQVNGTFGGPIPLPWVPRNRRPNLMLTYQHMANTTATSASAIVPTALERAGDFSQSVDALGRPVAPRDPLTGLPFAGAAIPAARLSPQAQALLAYFPAPTVTDASGYNYQASLLHATRQDGVQTRVTQSITPRDTLMGAVSYQRTRGDERSLLGFRDESAGSQVQADVQWFRRLGIFGSLRPRYQFTQARSTTRPYFAHRTNVSGEAGIVGNNQDPVNWGPPTLIFGGGVTTLSDADAASTRTRTHTAGAEVYWNHRRHNLTVGGTLTHTAVDSRAQQNPRGAFTFAGTMTGSSVADFLLGLPTTTALATGPADKFFRAPSFDAYVTDDLRLSPSLTVNVGVRWEYEAPVVEALNRLVNLDVAAGFGAIAPVLASDPTGALTRARFGRALLRPDRGGIQPRTALAWRPIPGSSLVVRAGYGIYRNTSVYLPLATLLSQQPPLSTTFTVATDPAHPVTLATALLTPGVNTATNTVAIDPDLRVGASHTWQVSAQRDYPFSLTVLASYLGTRGTHLLQETLPNTFPVGADNPCPTCPSGFVYLTSHGTSVRHAAQLQVRRRLRSGLTAQVQYTLATATDNATAFSGASLSATAIAQDWRDLDAERAPSAFDQRHLAKAQVTYTTGMGVTGGTLIDGWRGRLLKGWTVSSQLVAGSGLPFTPYLLAPLGGSGITGPLRPSLTGASRQAPAGAYLNPAAYTAPAPGQWGDAGRHSVRGPAQFSLDAAAARTFTWGERLSLDWRIEASNLLNAVTYASVTGLVGSPQFGLPNRANEMRKLQTSVRVRF